MYCWKGAVSSFQISVRASNDSKSSVNSLVVLSLLLLGGLFALLISPRNANCSSLVLYGLKSTYLFAA